MALRKQLPSSPKNWLHDGAQDYTRIFSKLVYLGIYAEPWSECTDAEKEAWEREHLSADEPQEAEVV